MILTGDMTSEIKRILVGIDGSSNSNRAAKFAAQIAKGFGASVTLVFVVTPSDHDMLAGKSTTMDEGKKGFGEQRLEKARSIFTDDGIDAGSDIEFGNAAEKILNVSERGYDLVVLGTRGQSAVRGFLMGSVSSQVSQHSKIPVVVVP
jgi:nucleotide-binding universal stress UspA family protein